MSLCPHCKHPLFEIRVCESRWIESYITKDKKNKVDFGEEAGGDTCETLWQCPECDEEIANNWHEAISKIEARL